MRGATGVVRLPQGHRRAHAITPPKLPTSLASPSVAKPDIAGEAAALDVARRHRELIAGLCVGAPVGVDLDRPAAGELKPCRLLPQRHLDWRSAKDRRGARPPAFPDIAPDIGLPDLPAVGHDRGLSEQAKPSSRAIGRAEIDVLEP